MKRPSLASKSEYRNISWTCRAQNVLAGNKLGRIAVQSNILNLAHEDGG